MMSRRRRQADSDDPRVVLAFDKFRGTAGSVELGLAAAGAAAEAGWTPRVVPLADGGEGSLEVLGGANKVTTVTGPLGQPVEAGWRLEGREAFIEMSAASGLVLAGGAEDNDPLEASTVGTGQLIAQAVEVGARTIYVLLGGSATTDGGLGALEALPPPGRLKEVDIVVACDVDTFFVDAATVFAPQKGASPAQVKLLTRRLERLQQLYLDRYEVDLATVSGAGAAGGLAGGLVAIGARLQSGFELLAERAGLDDLLHDAALCITGEGRLDAGSFSGKVVGGVYRWASEMGVPVVAVVGVIADDVGRPDDLEVRSLVEIYGRDRALGETSVLVAEQVGEILSARFLSSDIGRD